MTKVRKGMTYNILKPKGRGMFTKLILALWLFVIMYVLYLLLGVK